VSEPLRDGLDERGVGPWSSSPSSPYVTFDQEEWGRLRADTPLSLTEADLEELRGVNESVSLDEVTNVYLPLSRLLNLYVGASQGLYALTARFLGNREPASCRRCCVDGPTTRRWTW